MRWLMEKEQQYGGYSENNAPQYATHTHTHCLQVAAGAWLRLLYLMIARQKQQARHREMCVCVLPVGDVSEAMGECVC